MDNNKQLLSFWVIKNDEPQLLEGRLIPEGEGEWSEGQDRFHTSDGGYYVSWFNTPEEAIKNKIETEEFNLSFEKEMFDVQLEEIKKRKQFWVDMLNKQYPTKYQYVQGRIETGAVEFEDDWRCVVIRGDNAAYYGMHLKSLLEFVSKNKNNLGVDGVDSFSSVICEELLDILQGSNQFQENQEVQLLKKYQDCVREPTNKK